MLPLLQSLLAAVVVVAGACACCRTAAVTHSLTHARTERLSRASAVPSAWVVKEAARVLEIVRPELTACATLKPQTAARLQARQSGLNAVSLLCVAIASTTTTTTLCSTGSSATCDAVSPRRGCIGDVQRARCGDCILTGLDRFILVERGTAANQGGYLFYDTVRRVWVRSGKACGSLANFISRLEQHVAGSKVGGSYFYDCYPSSTMLVRATCAWCVCVCVTVWVADGQLDFSTILFTLPSSLEARSCADGRRSQCMPRTLRAACTRRWHRLRSARRGRADLREWRRVGLVLVVAGDARGHQQARRRHP